jgi:hypothetical protein
VSKKYIVHNVRVECNPPGYITWAQTLSGRTKQLEEWVKEFNQFIRDHRSQDEVRLKVVTDRMEVCEYCEMEWEGDHQEPACCQKAIDEFEKRQRKIPA